MDRSSGYVEWLSESDSIYARVGIDSGRITFRVRPSGDPEFPCQLFVHLDGEPVEGFESDARSIMDCAAYVFDTAEGK
jgi:hypothetical protein